MSKRLMLSIFGGTGDLTFRKLLPALYSMAQSGELPESARILIIGRREYTDTSYRAYAREWVEKFSRAPFEEEAFARFANQLSYLRMDFSRVESFAALDSYFKELGEWEHVFYLAVAPKLFSVIAQGLAHVTGAVSGKIILEKPFGEDLASAQELNNRLEEVFSSEQIYRIDHYLGKEMVRGITAIRFTNPIFNYVWDARQIEYIEISALEQLGVESRGGYYDGAGALQDMVQNHLFQILSILAMERPDQFSGAAMHSEQLKVLHALRAPSQENLEGTVVLGQYKGYRSEPSVAPESRTETFAALRMFVDNDRWRNMPFYIRTGKKTGVRATWVTVVFRSMAPGVPGNKLVLRIQPEEGTELQFNIKKPGETDELVEAKMDFCQNCMSKNQSNTPEAYERLLTACIQGEQSWFSQWDQIEEGWKYVEELRALIASQKFPVLEYEAGASGPLSASGIPEQFGHRWSDDHSTRR